MKKIVFTLFTLLMIFNANAFIKTNDIKIFKDYPFNMHKSDFLKKFRHFGECNVSNDVICAPNGYEKLYGIPFNINVQLKNNRTAFIKLHSTKWVDGATYLELFKGLIKSGFAIYEVEDQTGKVNLYDEIFKQNGKLEHDPFDEKLTALENANTGSAILKYVEKNKLDQALTKGQKFTSTQSIFDNLPIDTRFINVEISKVGKDGFIFFITIDLPKMEKSQKEDRPTEKI